MDDLTTKLKELYEKPKTLETSGKIPAISTNDRIRQQYQELSDKIGENIIKSTGLRSAINKGVNDGLSERDLLFMCIECISLMTGDVVFRGNIGKLKNKFNSEG